MADRKHKDMAAGITFTVAECGEFHSMGEYHEGITSLEEAAAIYRRIPQERMNGVPSVGIRIHIDGSVAEEDVQLDILAGSEINSGVLRMLPKGCSSAQVQRIISETAVMFPEKEVAKYKKPYFHLKMRFF